MTEAQWLTCGDPQPMLESLRGKVTGRKLRLIAVAGCRHVTHLMTDARSRAAVEVAERYADGSATEIERQAALEAADEVMTEVTLRTPEVYSVSMSAAAAMNAADSDEGFVGPGAELFYLVANPLDAIAYEKREQGSDAAAAVRDERGALAALLRDVAGPLPFRPIAFSAEWRTSTAVALARQMYEARDFGAMPILADALQDAGCDGDEILSHLRDTDAPHVRGCWALDLVLGKS